MSERELERIHWKMTSFKSCSEEKWKIFFLLSTAGVLITLRIKGISLQYIVPETGINVEWIDEKISL